MEWVWDRYDTKQKVCCTVLEELLNSMTFALSTLQNFFPKCYEILNEFHSKLDCIVA